MKKFRILEVKQAGNTSYFKVQNQRHFLWMKMLPFWSSTWFFNDGTADYSCWASTFEEANEMLTRIVDDYQKYLDSEVVGAATVKEVHVG